MICLDGYSSILKGKDFIILTGWLGGPQTARFIETNEVL